MPPLNKQQFGEKMAAALKEPMQTSGAWEHKVLRRKPADKEWRGPLGSAHTMSANRSRDVTG